MDSEDAELTPLELIKHAKKHPHSHNISTEAFTTMGRDFVVHNLSMKGDPTNIFDITNYRRGLAIIEEIVNFKEGPPRVGKKGLRKFMDLLPEYLDTKKDSFSGSKHHIACKSQIFSDLQSAKAKEYIVYSSEKANGENAQISWDADGQFWVIGSKNKTLLLGGKNDLKYITNKFEHVRTLSIADMWFNILESVSEHTESIKEVLSHNTLVGEICDTVKSGHIVDYGTEPQLYFYALVRKQEQQHSCQPPSELQSFLKTHSMEKYAVKFKKISVNSYEALQDQLKLEVARVFEATLEEGGEGVVVYITTIDPEDHEICRSISKIKTLEYRIYRKLRQKLKNFFEKVKKSYDKSLNKFKEEVKELVRHFKTPKPLEYYFQIARKAFEFCENQEKAVLKFISNKFIAFLKLLQQEDIDKKAFMSIVYDDTNTDKAKKETVQASKKEEDKSNQQPATTQDKHVLVLIPLTIPSTGKSTLFRQLKQSNPQFCVKVLSSDTVREEVMKEKMSRQKSLTKKAAYEKSRKEANDRYYKYMGEIFAQMTKETSQELVLFLDKNHPENALKTTIEEIRSKSSKYPTLKVKIIGVLPLCEQILQDKPKYMYPFSSIYIATCMKRVLSRDQHQTLEGTENERANVCLCFANMFRNFSLSEYHLSKYFDSAIYLPFTSEVKLEKQIEALIINIMLKSKPGSFQEHESMGELVQKLKEWKSPQMESGVAIEMSSKIIRGVFSEFETMKVKETQKE